jgi:hypothetical protein
LTIVFANAVFSDNTPWVAGEAAGFKTFAAEIKAAAVTSRDRFLPEQICSWDPPSYLTGGMAYSVSVITGLTSGDIVHKTYNQYWTADYAARNYEWFNGGDFYILIGDYTHNPGTNRIYDWLHYIVKEADGTYTLYTGQGVYYLLNSAAELPDIVGYGMRTEESFGIYRGATLVNPQVSPRGYTYGTGISGGSIIAGRSYFNNQDILYPSEVWVDDDWASHTQGDTVEGHVYAFDAFATVREGVTAAAPTGTVNVAAGTYDEQIVIGKSLTLQGAGDTTVVKPSSDAKLTQVFDGLFWYGGTKQIAGIIVANVPDGSSVNVKNLKVDESGVNTKPTGADYLAGVFYRETGGTVDTVSVVGGGSWSGSDRAFGMYLSAATNTVSVEVKGSTITNFDKEGINAEGNKLTVNIHDNTITGRGPTLVGDEVQNGVDIGRDAVGTVNYNTISNLEYGPKTWWAAGIMFYHYVSPAGKSATAKGNTITDCQIGIIFKNANGVAQDNTVSGGTVGLIGVYAEPNYAGTYTASFVGNTVSGVRDCTFDYGGKTYYYENAAIGANTYDTLTSGTGASLTVTVRNNQLTGGGSTDADGVMIDGSVKCPQSVTATISDNIISGWNHGINLASSSVAGATITGNTIQNNVGTGSGVHVDSAVDATKVHVNLNNIVGNSGTGVYGVSNSGSGTLDAEGNWWGSATGPTHASNPGGTGDRVSDNVDFIPWIGAQVYPSRGLWFAWYDMAGASWDAIHVVNPGTVQATVQIYVGGELKDAFSLDAGGSTYRTYPGLVGGPVYIFSDQAVWASERILGWNSFKEIPACPDELASTDIYFTWYDMRSASWDAIHVINPSSSEVAEVNVYIGGVLKTSSPIIVNPGEVEYVTYPGEVGGPVELISSIPVLSAQRIVGWNDFDEVIGIPAERAAKEHWFTWYDMAGASWDAIHMVNPGTVSANVEIYIAGNLQTSLTLPPEGIDFTVFPGLVGGPVRVVSDQQIIVTRRILGWNAFHELQSVPSESMANSWYFSWYDMQGASWDAIHIANPSSTATATVRVYIAGELKDTREITPGQQVALTYPGLMNGPVIVASDIPVFTTQRIVGWSSFDEIAGVPWGAPPP